MVVIGGGTAGLEAACTAAEVGCNVFLIEKKDYLGGLAAEISRIPDKVRLNDFPTYLINRAKNLHNLYLFTGEDAVVDRVKRLNPDIIVNATGSNPLLPPIKGLFDYIDKEDSRISSITGMIGHIPDYPNDLTGKTGSGGGRRCRWTGCGGIYGPRGAKVSIVEMMPDIGKDLDPVSKSGINAMMKKYEVVQLTGATLTEVRESSFLISQNGTETELPFDYGFVCLGMRANTRSSMICIRPLMILMQRSSTLETASGREES